MYFVEDKYGNLPAHYRLRLVCDDLDKCMNH